MSNGPLPIPLSCPRCAAHVEPEQDWCLVCGAAARTRLAPTPNWKLPVTVLATIALLAGLALALAFVELTGDDEPVTQATTEAPAEPEATTATTDTVPTAPPVTSTSPTLPTTTPTTPTAPPVTTTPTIPGTTIPTIPGTTVPTVPGATTPSP